MEDAQYKQLLHSAPFGFAYHKILVNSSGQPIDYVFLEVNPAFEKLTGLNAEAVINQPVTTAIPALVNDDFDWIGFYGQVALTGQEKEFEQYAQSLQRWYKVHAYSPQPYYFSTTFVDITESVQAKETLREVLENSLDASYKRNLHTNTYDYLSPVITRLCGYTLDEIKSMSIETILEFIHPDDRAKIDHFFGWLKPESAHTTHQLDYRFKHKNGQYRWLHDELIVVPNQDGQPAALIGSISDITERKQAEAEKTRLEAQNRQLQKAESLARMAGAIAHHFNNQLQAIMGRLEMAMNFNRSPVDKNLSQAMTAARRAAEMSGLMLVYLGQTSDTLEPLDLAEICILGEAALRETLPPTVTLEINLPDSGPMVEANAARIHQLLTHLITNARESIINHPGVIRLSVTTVSPADIPAAPRFPLDWQPQERRYACLEVADTGAGIAARDIEKLFDPFFSTKFAGRGLGLAVVLGVVRSYLGVVTVDSYPGRGSAFRLFFPIAPQTEPQPPEPMVDTPANAGTVTVLLVEDEEMIRLLIEEMLIELGYTVLAASDGMMAVEIFKQQPDKIDCVLCHVTMPRMDGWATLTALRRLAPNIPVILSSGYDEAQVMAGHHPDRPQAFLSKPYQMNKVNQIIQQVLAARPVGQQSS